MGFFGSLFEKKQCSICGGEIGLLGNRKLEDGNCCKTCARKLSPWFEERRHSTVAQIQQQLAYREENRAQLGSFRPSLSYGETYEVKAELSGGVPTRFVVAQTDNYLEENADLIRFDQVTSFTIDIDESQQELKYTNSQGESVSYNPRRYEYSYDFNARILVNHPYFDDISFRVNRNTLELQTVATGFGLFSANTGFDPMQYPEYRQMKTYCEELEALFRAGMTRQPLPGQAPAYAPNYAAPAYAAPAAPAYAAPAPAAPASWQCAACGSANTGKFCASCGSPKPAAATVCTGCGWRSQGAMPKFCPECGKPFGV